MIDDDLRDLCRWNVIIFADREALERSRKHHAAYHERKAREAHIIRSISIRMSRGVQWGDLTDREQDIMRAYAAGADLPC